MGDLVRYILWIEVHPQSILGIIAFRWQRAHDYGRYFGVVRRYGGSTISCLDRRMREPWSFPRISSKNLFRRVLNLNWKKMSIKTVVIPMRVWLRGDWCKQSFNKSAGNDVNNSINQTSLIALSINVVYLHFHFPVDGETNFPSMFLNDKDE